MKKNYFAPVTKVVKVKLYQMIAASPLNSFTDTEGKGTLQNVVGDDGVVMSRRGGSIWDDEE